MMCEKYTEPHAERANFSSLQSRDRGIRSRKMQPLIFFCLAGVIALAVAPCPATKKAHPTSCTLFYNCVPLPNGGYVWVPSKCADGLVFQPYLRLCVLPGDLWTCATASTQPPPPPSDHDNAQIHYLKPTPNSLEFSNLMDLPFTTDDMSASPDIQTNTPYPLDEIEEATEMEPDKTNPCTPSDNTAQNTVGAYPLLSNLLSHLLEHKDMTIPLESLIVSTTSAESGQSQSTVPIDSKKTTQQHNVLANYLIQNYIQQNNLQTTVISRVNLENTTRVENATTEASINDILINTNGDNAGLMINKVDGDSNIVLIKDGSGSNQYLTIEKYQSHSHYLNSKYAIVIPCVRNIRLPNTTNCNKYYTCDPATALVMEYSCPQNTAFNMYSRVCDTESRVTCIKASSENAAQAGVAQATTKPPLEKICAELGKIKDPSSDFHYFICYAPSTSSSQIKSIRLACPNGLVFCQSKKFCTTRRLCTSSAN